MFVFRLLLVSIVLVAILTTVWRRLEGPARIGLTVLASIIGLAITLINLEFAQPLFWILLGLALGGVLYADRTYTSELSRQMVLFTLLMVGGLYLIVIRGGEAFLILLEGLSVEFIGAALTTLVVTIYSLWRGREMSTDTEAQIIARLDALTEEVRQLRR